MCLPARVVDAWADKHGAGLRLLPLFLFDKGFIKLVEHVKRVLRDFSCWLPLLGGRTSSFCAYSVSDLVEPKQNLSRLLIRIPLGYHNTSKLV